MASSVTMTQGAAAGAFAFTSQVAADDTVVIGDVTYTFKAAPSLANEVDIGTNLDGSIQNLVAAINADSSGETGGGGAGEAYGSGTVANPYFTASQDVLNDEADLTARGAGSWANGIYLAATSPGTNSITAGGVTFSAIPGGTDGAGVLDDFATDLLDLNQINSELQFQIKKLTDAAD